MIAPLIGAGILAGIGIAIGLILLIVPGLFLLTIWAVIAPVIVIERTGVFGSFGRSQQLVKGNGWQVFGVILIIFLGTLIVSAILQGIFSAISDSFVGYAIGDADHPRADRPDLRPRRRGPLLRAQASPWRAGAGGGRAGRSAPPIPHSSRPHRTPPGSPRRPRSRAHRAAGLKRRAVRSSRAVPSRAERPQAARSRPAPSRRSGLQARS